MKCTVKKQYMTRSIYAIQNKKTGSNNKTYLKYTYIYMYKIKIMIFKCQYITQTCNALAVTITKLHCNVRY